MIEAHKLKLISDILNYSMNANKSLILPNKACNTIQKNWKHWRASWWALKWNM